MRTLLAVLFSLTNCAASLKKPTPAPAPAPAPSAATLFELRDFTKATVDGLSDALKSVDAAGGEVWLRLDSYGGSIHEGQRLMTALEGMKHARVTCVADQKAMSMAFYLMQSHGCKQRLMTRRSVLMAHEPLMSSTGGNEHALRDDADYLRALTSGFVASAAKRMHLSEDYVRAKITNRTWYMDADEAARVNAIDAFVEPEDLPPATPYEVKQNLLDW